MDSVATGLGGGVPAGVGAAAFHIFGTVNAWPRQATNGAIAGDLRHFLVRPIAQGAHLENGDIRQPPLGWLPADELFKNAMSSRKQRARTW